METERPGGQLIQQKELLKRCMRGDRSAQLEIYRSHYKAMYNTCLRLVSDPATAEDIMQESFLKAFEKLGDFRGDVSFGAWLKRIVLNRSLDHLRKLKRLREETLDEKYELIADDEDVFEDPDSELIERVKQGIALLPDGYRVVLSLHLLEGFDYDEIAEVLGISSSTARSQFARAKAKLIENLKRK